MTQNWEDILPAVEGRYSYDVPLGQKSWFSCGGNAAVMFKPKDGEDLQNFLKNCPEDIAIFSFGALSNTIIRDGGLEGVVIRLGRDFAKIEHNSENALTAGAMALDANVALKAASFGIAGLEFFSGIPGSVGGALKMNAGCYGSETKDVLKECYALDRQGNEYVLTLNDLQMSYRHTEGAEDLIFTKALFEGQKDQPEKISQRIETIKSKREESQPIREKTGGSTFANPKAEDLDAANLSPETKVWQLIDRVGGRGLKVGGAKMSEKHCNFMINTGEASAQNLEDLGEEIRKRVHEQFGIALRWEIRRVGKSLL